MRSLDEELELMDTKDNFFELYSSMSGYKAANRKIAAAVRRSIKFALKQPRSVPKGLVLAEAYRRVEKVLDRYVDLGAQDSEPGHHVERILEKALE